MASRRADPVRRTGDRNPSPTPQRVIAGTTRCAWARERSLTYTCHGKVKAPDPGTGGDQVTIEDVASTTWRNRLRHLPSQGMSIQVAEDTRGYRRLVNSAADK